MSATSLVPAIVAWLVVILTIALLDRLSPIKITPYKYATISSLRGYLALFVCLHHICIWYFFIHTQTWAKPPSDVYTYFGTGSVMLFFMITSFLFFGRLLDARNAKTDIDWLRLYVSRFLRICPLYVFAVTLAFFIAGYVSQWAFSITVSELLLRLIVSLAFGIFGAPVLETLSNGTPVMGYVVWTLQYEWVFYGFLPLLALCLKLKVPRALCLLPLIALAFFLILQHLPLAYLPFVSGMIAAYIARSGLREYIAKSKIAAAVFFILLISAMLLFSDPMGPFAQIILCVCFIIIACGNSLFGLLEWRYSRLLGEMAYSIYLLHCLVLYFVYKVIVKDARLLELSPTQYWLVAILSISALIILCHYTFLFIEKPMMNSVDSLTRRIRSAQRFLSIK